MKFEQGFPAPNGADDFEDSSHLAGILAVMNHPDQVDMRKYVVNVGGPPPYGPMWKYIRCPNPKNDVSRDQAIEIMCGLIVQGHTELVDLKFIDGRDIMLPSVRGIERIAKKGSATWFQKWWFRQEIKLNGWLQQLEEPFQIFSMCRVYGDEFFVYWMEKNPKWMWAIRRYFYQLDGQWRAEPELAEYAIEYALTRARIYKNIRDRGTVV